MYSKVHTLADANFHFGAVWRHNACQNATTAIIISSHPRTMQDVVIPTMIELLDTTNRLGRESTQEAQALGCPSTQE